MAGGSHKNRTTHRAYRRKRDQLRRTSDTCHLCGGWIDPDLRSPHPLSFTADHVIPVSKGGSNLGELRAAHRRCNSRRGNRDGLPAAGERHGRRW